MSEVIVTSKAELSAIIAKAIADNMAMQPGSTTGKEETEIINTDVLCKRLDVSEPTIIRLRKAKKIPFFTVGTAVRYNYNEVIKALENNKRK